MSDYDLINGEILTVTVTVDEETVIANINTAARGPAGPAGGGSSSITSATTSDGTADLDLLNVETVTATVTGTLTADHIHGNLAGSVYAHIRAGEALEKGDPVYVSGSHGSGSTLIPIVSKADASNAAKMPAIGIMDAAVANNANGHMVIVGTITELDTTGLTVNAELYVAAGGGMTATPPTARAQPVARVERVNANNGAVIVKVNGLSASDATGNTLVRRTSGGGASFAGIALSGLNTNSGSYSQVGGANFNVATTTTANLTATGSGIVTVSGEGGTTISGGTLTFSPSGFTYGTGAASAHRIALGAGTTGTALFGAADAAAARTTLELATTDTPTFAGVTTARVSTTGASLRLAATLSGTDFQRFDLFTSGLTRIGIFTNNTQRIGIQNTGQIDVSSPVVSTSTITSSNFKRGTGSPESVVTGIVGDIFVRTDGGAGTTLYVKESGTGNTGWVAK
jgi:hypothetical protein